MKRLALLIVAVSVAGWACAGNAPEGPRKLKFALIPKALDIPVFNYANQGAQRQAAEFGDVEVIYRGPDHGDALKQQEVLEAAGTYVQELRELREGKEAGIDPG